MSQGKKDYEARRAAKHPRTIEFQYIRAPFFRTVHADGCFGGVSPRDCLHLGFFSERNAVPKKISYEAKMIQNGELMKQGPELHRDGYAGIEREIEVDVIMTLDVAKTFYEWFGKKIIQLEAVVEMKQRGETPEPIKSEAVSSEQIIENEEKTNE